MATLTIGILGGSRVFLHSHLSLCWRNANVCDFVLHERVIRSRFQIWVRCGGPFGAWLFTLFKSVQILAIFQTSHLNEWLNNQSSCPILFLVFVLSCLPDLIDILTFQFSNYIQTNRAKLFSFGRFRVVNQLQCSSENERKEGTSKDVLPFCTHFQLVCKMRSSCESTGFDLSSLECSARKNSNDHL